jgi:hypothetical protein
MAALGLGATAGDGPCSEKTAAVLSEEVDAKKRASGEKTSFNVYARWAAMRATGTGFMYPVDAELCWATAEPEARPDPVGTGLGLDRSSWA